MVTFAAQAAETIAYAIADEAKAKERYQSWLSDPNNAAPAQSASHNLMDTVCGNNYTPPEAEKIFDGFQFAANFASAPKLFASAAKSWPPPFAKGKGTPDEINDFINSLNPCKGGKGAKGGKDGKSEGSKPSSNHPSTPETTSPSLTAKLAKTDTTAQPSATQARCKRGSNEKGDGQGRYKAFPSGAAVRSTADVFPRLQERRDTIQSQELQGSKGRHT